MVGEVLVREGFLEAVVHLNRAANVKSGDAEQAPRTHKVLVPRRQIMGDADREGNQVPHAFKKMPAHTHKVVHARHAGKKGDHTH